jgi:hypothetical protein
VCHAGRVEIVLPPQWLQRSRRPASGTVRVSGKASTLTSADRPQLAQVAVTARTPFKRMLARVIGGPGFERVVIALADYLTQPEEEARKASAPQSQPQSQPHSRRLQRVFDRATKGHPTHVTVQAARYSNFDPDRWWETRFGIRIEIIELQKLLLDTVHPMSF